MSHAISATLERYIDGTFGTRSMLVVITAPGVKVTSADYTAVYTASRVNLLLYFILDRFDDPARKGTNGVCEVHTLK